jgi:PAS domain S-box-containing protein
MLRRSLIYKLFITLLVFAVVLIVPTSLIITQTSKKMITQMEEIGPLSAEQRLIYERFASTVKENFISLAFYIFIISFIVALFFSRAVLRPIRELYQGAKALKEGNLDVRLQPREPDELGEVVKAFNEMAEALKQKTEELMLKDRYVSTMTDPLWVVDEANNIVDINPAFTQLLGYEREDVLGYSVFDFVDEESEKTLRKHLQMRQEGLSSTYEISIISKTGELIPVLVSGAPILNEQGQVVAKIGIMKDFRKELSLRKALQEAGAFREAIMDSMPDILLVIDREFRITMANRAALEASDGPVVGRTCHEVYHAMPNRCSTHGVPDCPVMAVFATGQPFSTVHEHIEKGGKRVYREIIAYPVKDSSGEVLSAVELMRDITEKKQYEDEIAQKNKELTTLLGLSRVINQSLKAEELFEAMVERLAELMGMDGGGIFILDELGRELALTYTKGISEEFLGPLQRFRTGEDIPGRVAATGQLFLSADITRDPRLERSVLRHTGIRAFACCPIKGKEKALGVLYMLSFATHDFSPTEERILHSVGEMMGMAMENIRLYDKMRSLYEQQRWRRSREQQHILQIVTALAQEMELQETLQGTLKMLRDALRADLAWLLEQDAQGNLAVAAAAGLDVPRGSTVYEKEISSLERYCLEHKSPVVVAELSMEPRFYVSELLGRENFRSACCVPVQSGQKALAALSLYFASYRKLEEEDIFFLQTAASILYVAMERAKLYETTLLQREMAETVLQSIQDGIVTVDVHGRVVSLNRAAAELIGLSAGSALRKEAWKILGYSEHNQLLSLFLKEALEASLRGRPMQKEGTLVDTRGRSIPVLASSYPFRDRRGKVAGVVYLLRDLSRQKEMDRLKSEVVRAVSHELRIPLSAIVGMTEMLLEDVVPPEKKHQYLETIHQEGLRLARMVSDLLDLARMEAGREALREEPLEPRRLLEELQEEFSPLLKAKEAVLELQTEGLPEEFLGDRDKLKQVLRNLLDNSLTYSDRGCRIQLGGARRDALLELWVKDTGWGMSPQELQRAGERFFRGKRASKLKGTGLGLALVKELVALMGGTVRIDSAPGAGTTVKITLPLRRQQ